MNTQTSKLDPKQFSKLALSKEMLDNLEKIGYKSMTEVQANTLPFILEKKDVIAQARTGSGKTAAFGIGVLSRLNVKRFRVQTLILCPTRELVEQVANELRVLAKFTHNIKILTLIGGKSFGQQLGSLRHNAHIIVGTPGRVLKHLDKGSLVLDELNSLVLDEADRILDMGFIEEVEKIIEYTPSKRQTLLFSATYPAEVLDISQRFQKDVLNIKVIEEEVTNKIEEQFYQVEDKLEVLIKLFSIYDPINVIVFCNTKIETDRVARELDYNHIDALALHGDMEQYDRLDTLVQFANKSIRVLVATDVAARGLDIKGLDLVVNYDIPFSQETYTHRIGRTGRAGNEGLAITLLESFELEKLEDTLGVVELSERDLKKIDTKEYTMESINATLVIEGGKKDKLRAGDILGSLTKDVGVAGDSIGKIDIYERQSYVAIDKDMIEKAQKGLQNTKIKSKKFSVWIL